MTEIKVPGPEPYWQPATQPPYYTGKNPAYQYSVWEHSVPLFQMIGGLELPVQPVAQRLRLHVERSWDGLDELDVVLFRLKGFSFAISKHDGIQPAISCVWLTQPHEQADKALDTLLAVVGIGEDAVAFRGDAHDYRAGRMAASQDPGSPDEVPSVLVPTSVWARFRRAIGMTATTQ
ncbi:hypothetical protein [Streptomyces sp. NPDC056883]|uniref:hypothetical protein n=1 Tax=Streptomyces sp. NPDC056883 TaxID=3345959 RepID=UPI0036D1DDB0